MTAEQANIAALSRAPLMTQNAIPAAKARTAKTGMILALLRLSFTLFHSLRGDVGALLASAGAAAPRFLMAVLLPDLVRPVGRCYHQRREYQFRLRWEAGLYVA